MKYIIATLVFLGIAAAILAVRVIIDRREIKRLESKWHKRVATKGRSRWISGEADEGFVRVLAEMSIILLLVIAVMGWLGFSR